MMLFRIDTAAPRDFAAFIAGAGQREGRAAAERAGRGGMGAYLWGKPGTGKSHLLAAAGILAGQSGRRACEFGAGAQGADLVLIDDIERATAADQENLFALLKASLLEGAPTVLAAGGAPPGQLPLRADVLSRLAELPAFRLAAMADEELVGILIGRAADFGRELDAGVARLLVESLPRNVGYLSQALAELDRRMIAADEKLTAAAARRWLRASHGIG